MSDDQPRTPSASAAAAAAIRDRIVGALSADLVGPFHPDHLRERLSLPPSRWYLTGFLAPETRRDVLVSRCDGSAPIEDTDSEEELAAGGDDDRESPPDETKTKRRSLWPASIGMSVLLPKEAKEVTVTVSWADYLSEPDDETKSPLGVAEGEGASVKRPKKQRRSWIRVPRDPQTLILTLGASPSPRPQSLTVPGSSGETTLALAASR